MKNIFRAVAISVVFMAIGVTDSLSQSAKMKMTTPILEGIATPDKLETSIGTLMSFDGVPDKEAIAYWDPLPTFLTAMAGVIPVA